MRKYLTLTIIVALITISTYSTLLLAEDTPQNASAERMQWWAKGPYLALNLKFYCSFVILRP
jgi:hypothetical protein